MIYLIDDKKERQLKYGWTSDVLEKHKNSLKPIWTYNEMADTQIRQSIFCGSNVICLHESFFKNSINRSENQDFAVTREKLVKHAKENPEALLVFFSGSMSSRQVNGNIIYVPVNQFYENLGYFIKEHIEGNKDERHLLYGKNPDLEKEIRQEYVRSTNDITEKAFQATNSTNFFLQQSSIELNINRPLVNCTEKSIGNDTSDTNLNQKINTWLNGDEYDNIFIPLCFGLTFADFNGLRLATLIRCTKSKNQLSKIYIYSFLNHADYLVELMEHECFEILKTKNIEFIGYSKKQFFDAANKEIAKFEIDQLPSEMSKLNLSIPENYTDNHSIANEFGIYQLAYNAGIDINEITDFNSEKLDSLYFKWLIAKNGLLVDIPKEQKEENSSYRRKLKGLTKKGFIPPNQLNRK